MARFETPRREEERPQELPAVRKQHHQVVSDGRRARRMNLAALFDEAKEVPINRGPGYGAAHGTYDKIPSEEIIAELGAPHRKGFGS